MNEDSKVQDRTVYEHQLPFPSSDTLVPISKGGVSYGGRGVTYEDGSYVDEDTDRIAKAAIQVSNQVLKKLTNGTGEFRGLESFVRSHRHLFPEQTAVIQNISFFRLQPHQLTSIGETDTESDVYGVRLIETLVVPYGCDAEPLIADYTPANHSRVKIEYRQDTDIVTDTVLQSCPRYQVTRQIEHPLVESNLDIDELRLPSDRHYYASSVRDLQPYRPLRSHVYTPEVGSYRSLRSRTYTPEVERIGRSHVVTEVSEDVREAMAPHKSNLYSSRFGGTTPVNGSPVSPLSVYAGEYLTSGYGRRYSTVDVAHDDDDLKSYVTSYPDVDIPTRSYYRAPSVSSTRSCRHRSLSALPLTTPLSTPTPTSGHSRYYSKTSRDISTPKRTSFFRERRTSSSQWCTSGGKVKITCTADTSSGKKITWYHNDILLADGSKYSITREDDTLMLEIKDVTSKDAGIYKVRTTGKDGEEIVCEATIKVNVTLEYNPPDEREYNEGYDGVIRPKFTQGIKNRNCVLDETVTFTVECEGRPAPTLSWFHDNTRLNESDRIHMTEDSNGVARLRIADLRKTDEGQYSCVASNRSCRVRTLGSLHIVENGQSSRTEFTKTADSSEIRCGDGKTMVAPKVVTSLPEKRNAKLGGGLRFSAVISGTPTPIVHWFKGERELTYSHRHRIEHDPITDRYGLEITSILQTDHGFYSVRAENGAGICESVCAVNVQVEGYEEDDEGAPRFINDLPSEFDIENGESFEIVCDTEEGNDGKRKTPVIKLTPSSEVNTPTTEISPGLPVDDFINDNVADQEIETSSENISSEENNEELENTDDKKQQPKNEGKEEIKEKVEIKKKVQIKENDDNIESDNKIKENDNSPTVEEASSPTDDIKTKVTELEDDHVTSDSSNDAIVELATDEVEVDLVDGSIEVDEVKIESTNGVKVVEMEETTTVTETTEVTETKEVTLITEVDDEKETEVIEKVIPEPDSKKKKSKKTIKEEESKSSKETKKSKKTSKKLLKKEDTVDEQEAVEDQIVASSKSESKSSEGKSSKKEAKKVKKVKSHKSKPEHITFEEESTHNEVELVFMTPLVDQTVTEGEIAILTVTSGVDLTKAIVKWYRNGALLENLGRFSIFNDNEGFTLKIKDVELTDAAMYTCVAQIKENGPASSCVCQLMVREKMLFTTKIVDSVIVEGDTGSFTCTTRGHYEQTKWLKDGKPITDKMEVTSKGDAFTLTIQNVTQSDLGKYSFVISRPGESRTTSAMLRFIEPESETEYETDVSED